MTTLRPLRRLLDGDRTWGSLRVDANHYGLTRYRLVVFPPGIAPDERLLLRVWRSWPVWGAVLFLTAEIWLSRSTSANAALAMSITLFLVSGAVAMALAGSTRGRVRSCTVVLMRGVEDAESLQAHRELQVLANLLNDADSRLADGLITGAEHEAVVWGVYERMDAETARTT
jgi:hypothetical protein